MSSDKLKAMVGARPSLGKQIFSRDYSAIFLSADGQLQTKLIEMPRGYPILFTGVLVSIVGNTSLLPTLRISDSSGGVLFQTQATPVSNIAGPGFFYSTRPYTEPLPFNTFMDERQVMTVEIDFNGYVGDVSVLLTGLVLRGS